MRWGGERWEGKGQPDGGQGRDKGQRTKARWQVCESQHLAEAAVGAVGQLGG